MIRFADFGELLEFARRTPATQEEIEQAQRELDALRGGGHVTVSGNPKEEIQGQDHERTRQEEVLSEVRI